MTAIDHILSANATVCSGKEQHEALPAPPSRELAVVTCMDARLDVLGSLGLVAGEAHMIRNAGGLVTDDVLRSLAISQRALGTREIAVIHHTKCGMQGFDDDDFRSTLADETGTPPTWQVPGFAEVEDQARESLAEIRSCPWLVHTDAVRAFVWDVTTDALHEVTLEPAD